MAKSGGFKIKGAAAAGKEPMKAKAGKGAKLPGMKFGGKK